jgi:hypothetical protein
LLNSGLSAMLSDRGLAPRALRDIEDAHRAGRFRTADSQLSLAFAAAALMALGQLLFDQPDRDDAESTDVMAADLLRVYGVPADEAIEICSRPLPTLEELAEAGSAA